MASYVAHAWKSGDTITADLLNSLENGVQNEQQGPKGDKGDKGDPGTPAPLAKDGKDGSNGTGITGIELTVDGTGKVTGGTATLTDNSTLVITVKQG